MRTFPSWNVSPWWAPCVRRSVGPPSRPGCGGRRRLPPPRLGQLDAAIGAMVEQASAGQALDGGGRRPRGDPEVGGELTRVGALAVLGQPEDGLERLALRLGEGSIHGLGGPQPTFWGPKNASLLGAASPLPGYSWTARRR